MRVQDPGAEWAPRRASSSLGRVVLIEDHALLTVLLVPVLERAGYTVQSGFSESVDTITSLITESEPDVVLLDFDLGPEVGTGLQFVAPAIEAGASVIALTSNDDPLVAAQYLEAGVSGVVPKSARPTELLAAIELAMAGEPVTDPIDRARIVNELRARRERQRQIQRAFDSLTSRERDILDAITAGDQAAKIALDRDVSLSTVRTHIRSILLKLGVNSQLAAVALAREAEDHQL